MRIVLHVAGHWALAVTLLGISMAGGDAQTSAKPGRRALLMGNSDYTRLPSLPSSVRDTDFLAEALKTAGFVVEIDRNVTNSGFPDVEKRFFSTVQPGDVCVLYFSGYALGWKRDNYLVPVDFDPARSKDGAYPDMDVDAYPLSNFVDRLREKQAGVRVVVVDDAWDEALRAAVAPGSDVGMRPVRDQISNSLFAFAADLGKTVQRPLGAVSSPFSAALGSALAKDGLDLVGLFTTVQKTVVASTGDRQVPYYKPNAPETFYFHAPVEVPVQKGLSADDVRRLTPQRAKDRQDYVYLKPGKFLMGCVPASKDVCLPDELPQHLVELTKGFWIGQHEVEISAYKRYLATSGRGNKMPPGPLFDGKWKQEDHPMVEVTWEEAGEYCKETSGRLPTEAEWEYAARGGTQNEAYPLNSENSRDKANFLGKQGNDMFDFTAPVKSFDPNPYRLYDMSGNVWEWCSDAFSKTYYGSSPKVDPIGPGEGKQRVIRGGSFASDPKKHLRLSYREGADPGRSNKIGFRCVIDEANEKRAFP